MALTIECRSINSYFSWTLSKSPSCFFFIAFTADHKRKIPHALLTALWSFLHLFPLCALLHFLVSPLSFFSSLFFKPPSTNRIQLFFYPKSTAETLTSKWWNRITLTENQIRALACIFHMYIADTHRMDDFQRNGSNTSLHTHTQKKCV